MDPFVLIKIGDSSLKTTIAKKSGIRPKWN
jgi:hypothetical protein